MYGYLIYDTAYMLVLYRWVGDPAIIAHHIMGLLCCTFGLYYQSFAIFGMAIQVRPAGPDYLLSVLPFTGISERIYVIYCRCAALQYRCHNMLSLCPTQLSSHRPVVLDRSSHFLIVLPLNLVPSICNTSTPLPFVYYVYYPPPPQ